MTDLYKYLMRNGQKHNIPFPAISIDFPTEQGHKGLELLSE